MPPYTQNFFHQEFTPCECCKLKYTTSTVTTHKWTKREIEEEILYFATKSSNAKWYERVDIRRQLKHWTDKLEIVNEVENMYQL